ncbi:MAG TPA: fibronectin type III domain-containing protein, partial [Baekduia sp.]|nr:fibronectin type III domain-containing protein [Baekduia sp.]
YKPTRFAAGRNGSGIDLEWAPSRERDIEWYRVYRYPVLGTRSLVCETKKTTCRHDSPPSSTLVTYRVVAVDYDSAGALREGALSDPVDVPLTNTPPSAPTNLQLTTQDDVTTLTWSASPGDPDLGDSVSYYRVYRDGQLVEDRYDRTGTAQELSFVDSRTNGMQHTYWVVAVDKRLAESAKLGPVTG